MRPGRVGDLRAPAVVDAHRQREHVVVAGQLLGACELLDHRATAAAPAGPADPHAELVHLVPAAADHVAVEAHEEAHLVGRSLPVLGREREGRDAVTPISIAPSTTSNSASSPISWPLVRGSPRSLAQRPLPSMTPPRARAPARPGRRRGRAAGCGAGGAPRRAWTPSPAPAVRRTAVSSVPATRATAYPARPLARRRGPRRPRRYRRAANRKACHPLLARRGDRHVSRGAADLRTAARRQAPCRRTRWTRPPHGSSRSCDAVPARCSHGGRPRGGRPRGLGLRVLSRLDDGGPPRLGTLATDFGLDPSTSPGRSRRWSAPGWPPVARPRRPPGEILRASEEGAAQLARSRRDADSAGRRPRHVLRARPAQPGRRGRPSTLRARDLEPPEHVATASAPTGPPTPRTGHAQPVDARPVDAQRST